MNNQRASEKIIEILECKDSYDFCSAPGRDRIGSYYKGQIDTYKLCFDIDYEGILKMFIEDLNQGNLSGAWRSILDILKRELEVEK